MKSISKLLLTWLAVILLALASPLRAETEKRIAFVVGNAAYPAGSLATSANDAGLIAQTLQAAGFDVAGARDLDSEALRAAFRDFLDKAQASGPDTVAFVYLSGYGAQLDGENYFAPVDAKIAAAPDVAVEALRVSDYTKRLAGLPLKASFIVLDAARASPFAKSGQPLAGGLALADAEPNMLVAFNAAPGTVAPSESGSYGAYARALAEMIREGGLSPSQVFDGVRLRVNEETKGAQAPWNVSRIAAPFVFFERAQDAPPPALAPEQVDALRSRPLGDLGAQDAYAAAIDRDTLQGYEEFLAAYPSDPLAKRVRAMLAARREALTWQRTCRVNTPDAYWSYLSRYPRGPHAADARQRLATLAAPEEPPPSFAPIVYDVPPPPPPEIIYVDRPVLVLDDPAFGFAPPPPIVFLAPPPAYLVFSPPPPPEELFVLPVPVFVPVPIWINPPAYVAPPPENVIFANIHNTTIINNNVINQGAPHLPAAAPGLPATAAVGAGVAAAAIAAKVALPPSVMKKATLNGAGSPGSPGLNPKQPASGPLPAHPGALPPIGSPHGGPLPGAHGKASPGPGGPPQSNPPAAHALPSGRQLPPLPSGHAAPAAAKIGPNGKPSPGPGGAPQSNPLAAHALPSGQQLPPGGHAAPGAAKPGANGKPSPAQDGQPAAPSQHQAGHAVPGAEPGQPAPPKAPPPGRQPLNKLPESQIPRQSGLAPSGPTGNPAVAGPAPAIVPKPQQPQQPQRQVQPSRPPQPEVQHPRAPQQAQQPRPAQPAYQQLRAPQQAQQPRPAQPAYQQPRAPQQVQQSRPPLQQQSKCGLPGLPPCH